MVRILCGLCLTGTLIAATGCSGNDLPPAQDVPHWEALDKLNSEEVMYPVVISAEHKDWKTVASEAAKPEFKGAVEAFASAEIPGKYATDARKQAKKQAVKDLKALIAAGEKKAPPKQIEAAYKKAMQSLNAVGKAGK